MVQSAKQNARTARLLAELESEIRDAVSDGLSLGEIQELVTTIVAEDKNEESQKQVPIYDEVPPGLITAEDAASKYGKSASTIRTWVQRGHLEEKARLRGAAKRGGKLVIDEAELVARLAEPPRQGRPKKNK
ncbi:MAG: helix-turn-helix domain-containing protein [SAR202 cluster bacterium]|nr:helix-turn-helix domain-containing protein [SAR202 cluster bacterium]